jgi:dolichyl-phosphate-mannose-protein mannosyltransferase
MRPIEPVPADDLPTAGRVGAVPAAARIWLPICASIALGTLAVELELTVRRSDRARFTYDSAEYAVAGRHLARTGNLATTCILPDELQAARRRAPGPRPPPYPLLVGHPLVPLLNAAAFRLGGEHPDLTLAPAAAAYLATVLCAAALAAAVAGPWLGVIAAAAVALAPGVLHYATEGLTELPFAACLTAGLWQLARLPARARPERAALALGLTLGIAHLARPVAAPLLPVWIAALLLAVPRGGRTRALGLALGGFIPFALALALFKLASAGSPLADVARYNLLSHLAPAFEPVRIHRMLDPPDPLAYLLSHPVAVMRKLTRFGPDIAVGVLAQGGVLGALGLLHALRMVGRRDARGLGVGLAGSVVGLVALITISLPSRRYLVPLIAPLLALGTVEAFALTQGAARRLGAGARTALRAGAAAALLLAAITSAHPTLRTWRWAWPRGVRDRGEFRESEWRAFGTAVAERLPAGTMVASDVPAWIAWYADRPAVLLPLAPADLARLAARAPVAAVVLSNEWLIDLRGEEAWRVLHRGGAPPSGWRVSGTVVTGRIRAVLLTRQAAAHDISPAGTRPARRSSNRRHAPSSPRRSPRRRRAAPPKGASTALFSSDSPTLRA